MTTRTRLITRTRLWWTLGIIAGLALIYLGLAIFSGRVIASGTTIAGVDVGGRSAESAEQALSSGLGDRPSAPIDLSAGEATATLSPEEAGLGVDVPASIDRVSGFTLDPTVLFTRLFGEEERAPVITVDDADFAAASEELAASLAVDPVDAEVAYSGTDPELSEGSPGQSVDTAALRTAVEEHWLRTDSVLPVNPETVEPDITTDEAQAVVDGFASEAVSGDRTITAVPAKGSPAEVKGGTLTISPSIIAETLSFEAKDSELVPAFDEEALLEAALEANEGIGRAAEDASFRIVDGRPEVVPGTRCIGVKGSELSQALTEAITGGSDEPEVTLRSVEPDFTTAEAKKADVSDTVSEFSTSYSSSPNRDNNLRVAAKEVSGTVIQPGEQFSLNETLGQRTAANGYKLAGVISNGQMAEDYGGGVSQISTTLFNAAFFAGFDLDEHRAHSRYISRYPEGRETTLDWTSIDLKFTNSSDTPVVLDMFLSGGEVHARMFGVKTLEVSSEASDRFDHTSPSTIHESGADCSPQSPRKGWSIRITRTMKEIATGRTSEDSFVTVYRPVNEVVCD